MTKTQLPTTTSKTQQLPAKTNVVRVWIRKHPYGVWIDNHRAQLLVAGGGLVIALVSATLQPWQICFVIAASVLMFIGSSMQQSDVEKLETANKALMDKEELVRQRTEELENLRLHVEKSQREYRQTIEGCLLIMLKRLVGDDTHSERINLFKHLSNQGRFELLARKATNGAFDGNGKPLYRDNSRCFSTLVTAGTFESDNAPDPNQGDGGKAYVEHLRDVENIPITIGKALRMKSRNVVGYRLLNPVKENLLGYIVVESVLTGRLNVGSLETAINGPEGELLSRLVESMGQYAPTTADAMAEDL